MNEINSWPKRKNPRYKGYDYSSPGYYFITFNTTGLSEDMLCEISSPVPVRAAHLGGPKGGDNIPLGYLAEICLVTLTSIGEIVKGAIEKIDTVYPNVHVDTYAIMPDHVHMILLIDDLESGPPRCAARTVSVSSVINALKSLCSRKIGHPIWHRSFYDCVIRTHDELNATRQYIEFNPARWLLNQHEGHDTHA